MKKLLIVGTMVLATALLVGGVLYPDHLLMWFASSDMAYGLTRVGVIAVLTVLLFSHPPRAIYFRIFLGLCAVSLTVVTATLLLTYQMGIVDAILLLEIAIIFAIEAVESAESYQRQAKLNQSSVSA